MTFMELAKKWRAERAHTYASENGSRCRIADAQRERCAEELEAVVQKFHKQIEDNRTMELDCISFGPLYALAVKVECEAVQKYMLGTLEAKQ